MKVNIPVGMRSKEQRPMSVNGRRAGEPGVRYADVLAAVKKAEGKSGNLICEVLIKIDQQVNQC